MWSESEKAAPVRVEWSEFVKGCPQGVGFCLDLSEVSGGAFDGAHGVVCHVGLHGVVPSRGNSISEVLELLSHLVLFPVPDLAVSGVVVAEKVWVGLNSLVGPVEKTVAVARLVTAGGEVLAPSAVLSNSARVAGEQVDVGGAESALRASSRGGEVSVVRHASTIPCRERQTQGLVPKPPSLRRAVGDGGVSLHFPPARYEEIQVSSAVHLEVGNRTSLLRLDQRSICASDQSRLEEVPGFLGPELRCHAHILPLDRQKSQGLVLPIDPMTRLRMIRAIRKRRKGR